MVRLSPRLRPDELKIYPCALVHNAELAGYYERGEYRPYSAESLVDLRIAEWERRLGAGDALVSCAPALMLP